MLDKHQLDRFGPLGFNLAQKEKDYAQYWILSFLAQSGFFGIFKGGTCLQKAYNLPRYSEDLDFTLNEAQLPDQNLLAKFLSSAGLTGVTFTWLDGEISSAVKVHFRGPLYSGKPISEGSVRLEFSKRETTLKKPFPVTISAPYPDILPFQFNVMDKGEIAAEKIRAILTRASARDLFDLYFILHGRTSLDLSLINKKLAGYQIKFNYADFSVRVNSLKGIWAKEISALTPNYLEFKLVSEAVLEKTQI